MSTLNHVAPLFGEYLKRTQWTKSSSNLYVPFMLRYIKRRSLWLCVTSRPFRVSYNYLLKKLFHFTTIGLTFYFYTADSRRWHIKFIEIKSILIVVLCTRPIHYHKTVRTPPRGFTRVSKFLRWHIHTYLIVVDRINIPQVLSEYT